MDHHHHHVVCLVQPLLPLLRGSFSKSFPLGPESNKAVRTNVCCSKHDQILKCVQNLRSANPIEKSKFLLKHFCMQPGCSALRGYVTTTTSTYSSAPAVNRRKLREHL